ncbi:MAG: hypothetical protein GF418_08010 [Chitinivibrionales bacterium]|nr:hypothetical protein [Chitinivibrionales bacterium]MBD3395557.1 hypothetical protein [Chitinivibrionales bacterium]
MDSSMTVLLATAASIGFFHTLTGPDHYLPFIVIGRARGWSLLRTTILTVICGIGHVGSSVVIGGIGIALGLFLGKLEFLEGVRGNLAAWALIAFGLVYAVWGFKKAMSGKKHEHRHDHADGAQHSHEHAHRAGHAHVHGDTKSITPWMLFIIFVLGPCEPLIPILMYPAAKQSVWGIVAVSIVFAAATIFTMTAIVIIASLGVNALPLGRVERYSHALAGLAICLSGVAIQFLGL